MRALLSGPKLILITILISAVINPIFAQFNGESVLFVVADATSLSLGESELEFRIFDFGLDCMTITASESNDVLAADFDLIIISATVNSGTTSTAMPGMREYEIPIINYEPFLYDYLGFQPADAGEFAASWIHIKNSNHFLAAGFPEDSVQVFFEEQQIGYGSPMGDVDIIATDKDSVHWATIFAYETGAAMYEGIAPARRVGSYLLNLTTLDFTDQGIALFKASLEWALGYENQTSVKELNSIPSAFELYNNYPNPFNPTTKIKYIIPVGEQSPIKMQKVTLFVYNILGRKIKTLVDLDQESGIYEVEFNAANLPSGVYYYKISSGNYSEAKKMLLLK